MEIISNKNLLRTQTYPNTFIGCKKIPKSWTFTESQSDQGPLSTILRTRTFDAPRSKASKTAMFGKSSSQPPITPYFSGDRWLFRLFEARQLRHVGAIDIGRRHLRLPSCTTEAAAAQVHRLEAEDSMGQAERMTSEVALVSMYSN